MKPHMKMPRHRAMPIPPKAMPGANPMASTPMGNPDMMEQQTGMVPARPMPARPGSLKNLRIMLQQHKPMRPMGY